MKLKLFIALLICQHHLIAQNCFDKCNENLSKAGYDIEAGEKIVAGLKGCEAPEFDVTTIDGSHLTLSQLKGKIVVLNFWFTSCAPCIAEIPALNKLVTEYSGKNVVFIALALDDSKSLASFLQKRKFSYQIVPSSSYLNDRFCIINGWPMNMILDQDGIVQQINAGGYADERAEKGTYNLLKPIIEKLLNKS